MAKVDEEFNLRDWEWIAVPFPQSQREAMAKVAWFICCKCTPEEISQYKNLDPKIVIPLCGIVLLNKKDFLQLKNLKEKKLGLEKLKLELEVLEVKLEFSKLSEPSKLSELKQEYTNKIKQNFLGINLSKKWLSLFEILDIDLQFAVLDCLIAYRYRPPTRDDWRNIFLPVKRVFLVEFFVEHFSVLSISILIMLLSLMVIKVADFFLELISHRNLVAFYLIWFAKFFFPFLGGVLFFFLTQTGLPFYPFYGAKSRNIRWLFGVFMYILALIYSIKYYNLGVFFVYVIASLIITGIIVVVLTIFRFFHVELKKIFILEILMLHGYMLPFYRFLTIDFSWETTLFIWVITLAFSLILWIYAQNLQRKVNNPLNIIIPLII